MFNTYNSYDSNKDKMSSLVVHAAFAFNELFWLAEFVGGISESSDGPRYDNNSKGSPPSVSSCK